MDPGLYKAVQEGNLNAMREKKELISTTQLTPNKNTLLHVAAQFNNSGECASEILKTNESLLYEVNSDGETALHVAARNGMENVGKAMMEFAKRLDRELEAGGVDEKLKRLLASKNIHGNTALHEAISNNRPPMVNLMIQEDPEIANIANNAMETPLFLAVNKTLFKCTDYLMTYCPLPDYRGPEGKTALHAVALYKWNGISEKLLEKHPTIITEVDDFGWSALHYAALRGSNEVAEELLKADKSIAYIVAEKDNNKTAFHVATCEGNVKIMEVILAYCPDCWEMVTGDGRNILHISVQFEQLEAFDFIMEKSWVGNLINQKDAGGNTPLHTYAASFDFFGRKLVHHPLADKNAVNKKNMTPLDVIMRSDDSMRRSGVWNELKSKGARLDSWDRQIRDISLPKKSYLEMKEKGVGFDYRKVCDTHIVVAALITTVAFAAGFTIPGGYDGNDGPNEGLAILLRKAAFKAFIITDTFAMVCSATAVFLYFIAVLRPADSGLVTTYFGAAAMLVIVAMVAMVIAFMTGLYSVLEHSLGLAITECVICSFYFPVFYYSVKWVQRSNI